MARIDTEETGGLESTTIGIFRTAATIKGGRRFSFGALVVVGDRDGTVGFGYGKANEVPSAIEKANKAGRRDARPVKLKGNTIPHTIEGRFGSSLVRLIPASPGTGVVAGAAVRAVLELAGIQDCLTKSYGSNNKRNLVKATLEGLRGLQTADEIAELRGVEIKRTRVDELLERGAAYMPKPTVKADEPVADAAPDAETATAVATEEPPADADKPAEAND
jgi:small subunit ribosomal protein S5